MDVRWVAYVEPVQEMKNEIKGRWEDNNKMNL
jgi:hypothetical protein